MSKKSSSRIARATSSSVILGLVAAVLATVNSFMQTKDRQLALGPSSPEQQQFFAQAVDRPDIGAFYKKLAPSEKIQAAQNLAQYSDPKMVSLAGIWLNDFDPNARAALSRSIKTLATKAPAGVISELKNNGGFQKVAVAEAIRSLGNAGIPLVAAALDKPETRANAIDFLVSTGRSTVPVVLPKLNSEDASVRLAAAEVLSKLEVKQAGPKILALLDASKDSERATLLADLSNIGWAGSESLFTSISEDKDSSEIDRSNAIFGLGRIATESSVRKLWRLFQTEPNLRTELVQALQAAGDMSLNSDIDLASRLKVASGLNTPTANAVIESAFSNPALMREAVEASRDRPGVAPALGKLLARLNPSSDGEAIDRSIAGLGSTSEGRRELLKLRADSRFAGFIRRQELLRNRSSD